MMTLTMYETLASLLGVPSCAIPLSFCRLTRPYLLERVGIPTTGTAILFVIPYLVRADMENPDRNLSLYAVPRDYHGYAETLKASLLPVMKERFPSHRFALFADHSPLAEVDAAARAGLGLLGDNGLLLTPRWGSYVFIAELITDADYGCVMGLDAGTALPDFPTEPPRCEGCGACRAACPARDGGTCLSALTQKKGELTEAEAVELQAHPLVWGCDVCQTVCPHNRDAEDTTVPYFLKERLVTVTPSSVERMDDDAFAARAYAWRGKATVLRNLKLKEEIP